MEGLDRINKIERKESPEGKKLRVANHLQMRLMRSLCPPEEGPDCFVEWPRKESEDGQENGAKFRQLFERVISEDPDFLNRWEEQQDMLTEIFVKEFQSNNAETKQRAA